MPKDRISLITAVFVIALALIIDLLQLFLTITVVGSVASLVLGGIVGFVLWLTFMLHGVKYTGKGALQKIGASFGTMVFELVPFIDALPLTTIGAIIIVRQTKKEDKEKRELAAAEARKKQQAAAAQLLAMQAQLQAANDNQELVEESLAA